METTLQVLTTPMPLQYQLIYFVTAFLNAAIAVGVFFRRPHERNIQAFSAFIVSITGWIATLYFFYTIVDPVSVIIVGRLNFAVTVLMAYFAFLFCALFPEPVVRISRAAHAVIAVGAAALAIVTFSTDFVDQVEIVRGVSRVTDYGPLYGLYVTCFVGLCVSSIVLLAYKYRKLKGVARRQILIFGAGWAAGFIWGTVTNIVIPALTGWYDVQHLGPLAALIMVSTTAYAVAKAELLDVKLIAVEVFIVFLDLLFVINIALSNSLPQQILGGASLVFVMLLGVALLRSVRDEVKRRKEMQALAVQLREANDHLKEADKLKSEFISIASHQLRTPITVIKGYVSLMLEGAYGPIPDAVREKIESMNAMNERLVQMINNMLNVSRIERNRIEYSCTKIDVGPLVREVVEEMSLKASQKKVALAAVIPMNEPLEAFVDSEKVQEVLTNLVDNAIKYTPAGRVDVAVRRLPKKKEILITISDTGLGMDKDTAQHVFQKFYRSKNPDVVREAGSGLGLYICAMFIRGMGGDIWVEKTEVGKGTTIAFRVPAEAGGQCLPRERRRLA